MKEQLVSFKTAKLAKEKGFDIPTVDLWYKGMGIAKLFKGKTKHIKYINCKEIYVGQDVDNYEVSFITIDDLLQKYSDYPASNKLYQAPTQSLLQKWLREKYDIHITIFSSSQVSWMYRITKPHQQLKKGLYGEDFTTYEETLEVTLQEALKLIKNKES